jgi:hypothetical protein
MRIPSFRQAVVVALGLALFVGCVELTGQRIGWLHDAAADELRFVIAYDGVHDDVKQESTILGRGPTGAEQLAKFVASGDVMFFDWFFYFPRDRVEGALADPEIGLAQRAFLERAKAIEVKVLGHQRDSEGRIGAVQHLRIREAQAFVSALNAALGEAIVRELEDESGFRRTVAKLRTAASTGFEFVKLDGHSFVITVPLDREEYRAGKVEMFSELLRESTKSDAKDRESNGHSLRFLLGALSSLATSWSEEPEFVRVVLGDRDRPNLLRTRIRDEYEPNLEAEIARQVPANLDDAIVDNMLADGSQPAPAFADLIAFGPPEVVALALARRADDAASPEADAARNGLRRLVESWNAAGRMPRAPTQVGATGHEAAVAEFVKALEVRSK